jgi:hypothetical protein
MTVIKGKEKFLKKRIPNGEVKLSAKAKKKMKRPNDSQPVQTICWGG